MVEATDVLVDEISEVDRVNVLAEKVEHEPVSQLAAVAHPLDVVLVGQLSSVSKNNEPHSGDEDDHRPVYQDNAGHDRQNDEPEPEEDVEIGRAHV